MNSVSMRFAGQHRLTYPTPATRERLARARGQAALTMKPFLPALLNVFQQTEPDKPVTCKQVATDKADLLQFNLHDGQKMELSAKYLSYRGKLTLLLRVTGSSDLVRAMDAYLKKVFEGIKPENDIRSVEPEEQVTYKFIPDDPPDWFFA